MRSASPVALAATLLIVAALPAHADDPPATAAAGRAMEVLGTIRREMTATRYQHHRQVRARRGEYFFDCSGMVEWVLSRASRRSRLALDRRPLAIDFVRRIERAPPDRFRRGWRRVERLVDVRPGDVFAWRRPEGFRSANTGHVGFVIATPRRAAPSSPVFAVRVADASRYVHEDDTRPWPGPGGFGHGTIAFVAGPDGRPIGYGWYGLRSRGYRETDVVFGRIGP